MSLSPEEKAELARANAQCMLLNNMDKYYRTVDVLKYPIRRPRYLLPNEGKNIYGVRSAVISYLGNPDELVNALTHDRASIATFVHATHAQLSLLQPKLEFTIRNNVVDPNTQQITPVDRPVHFSNFTKGETLKKIGKIREGRDEILGPQDGLNVGVKEFNWNFDNKHEGDRIVKAQLTLFFGSLAELTSEYYLDFIFVDGKRSVYQQATETTAEKIQRIQKSLKKAEGPLQNGKKSARERSNRLRDAQQLKVTVGWQRPDRDVPELFESPQDQKNFYEAVENFQKVLLLNITQYDIDFNQNGSVEVKIDYIASTDATIVSPEADVLGSDVEYGFVPLEGFTMLEDLLDLGRKDTVKDLPDAKAYKALYLQNRYIQAKSLGANGSPQGIVRPRSLGGKVQAFQVDVELLKAELEYLKDVQELMALKGANKPGASNSANAVNRDKAKRQYDAVADALDIAMTQGRRAKYQNFLFYLLENKRVFKAYAEYRDIEGVYRDGPPPKYLQVYHVANTDIWDLAGPKYGVLFLHNKLERLANVGTEATNAIDEEFLYQVLDPSQTFKEYEGTNSAPVQGEGRVIYYMRLGDLVQMAASNAGLSVEHEIIFGSFTPALAGIPMPSGLSDVMSLADIPISIDYFGMWFYDNVISMERTQYSFRRFLDDVLQGLVAPMLNSLCSGTRTFSMGYTLYTVDADTFIQGTAPLTAGGSLLTAKGQGFRYGPGSGHTVPSSKATKFVEACQKAAKRATIGTGRGLMTLILIHAEQVNHERRGDRIQDEKDGIFHFMIGADRGIAQEFNFQKKQMPQLRAMNIEKVNQGATKAGILVLPMDVSLSMFGNGLLRNGSMIFVNADYGLGSRVADSLALGGYYRVYKSSHTIRPGEYSSTVDCIFERPRNFPRG